MLVSSTASEVFAEGQDLLSERDVASALKRFNEAGLLGYNQDECAAARWQCWMLLGDFEAAWRESDAISVRGAHRRDGLWDGTSWRGKRVMLRCLHGLGDTIQFIRYAPLLRQSCRELIVQTHPELVRLIECVPGIDQVTTWGPTHGEDRSRWDMQMEVTELPYAFRTTVSTIPSQHPYFALPNECVATAAKSFENRPKTRIGLVLEASSWDPARSVPLSFRDRFSGLEDFEFMSLQKVGCSDVLDTAALITQMDLVISVDTMVAHLAGALGVPVVLLLRKAADWRWMTNRSDSPWYPRTKLLRQMTAGDWHPVLDEALNELRSSRRLPSRQNRSSHR